MSYQFENFVENYINKLNDIIYNHMYQNNNGNYEGKELVEKFDNYRKHISEFLAEEGLSSSSLIDTPNVRKDIKKSLKKIIQ